MNNKDVNKYIEGNIKKLTDWLDSANYSKEPIREIRDNFTLLHKILTLHIAAYEKELKKFEEKFRNTPTQFHTSIKPAEYVPWQRCPVCEGKGYKTTQTPLTICMIPCSTCNGGKMIPMHVLNK